MLASILPRLTIARLTMGVLAAAPMPGWVAFARASEPVGLAAPPAAPPLADSRPAVRRALREFDRFLDHHPLLEDRLRLDSQLTTSKAFLDQNPELSDFLRANPNVAEGLKVYTRYFLNRALMRQASAPVSFHDLAPFKDLFQEQPKLEQELRENPESIRDPVYLDLHPELRAFLVRYPALGGVFLPSSVRPESK
jgi:hypothetical protein